MRKYTLIIITLIGLIFAMQYLFVSREKSGGIQPVYLFEYGAKPVGAVDTRKPMYFEIPQNLAFGTSIVAYRTNHFNILTFYPGFTSAYDKKNRNFGLSCVGYCNGRIMIAIENYQSLFDKDSFAYGHVKDMGEYISNIYVNNIYMASQYGSNYVKVEHNQYNFQDVYKLKDNNYKDESNHIMESNTKKIILIQHKDKEKNRNISVQCNNSIHSTCEVSFSLLCDPSVFVMVNEYDFTKVEDIPEMVEKADDFVSSMYKNSACIKTN